MAATSISVFESPHIQGVILALRGMEKELAAQMRKATRSVAETEWRAILAHETDTMLENRVIVASARVSVTNTQVTLKAGQLTKKLSGGAPIFTMMPGTEWGTIPTRPVRSTSKKGKPYKRALGPVFKRRNKQGYVFGPAAAHAIPRIASLWVQTVVRTLHEAIEKGTR